MTNKMSKSSTAMDGGLPRWTALAIVSTLAALLCSCSRVHAFTSHSQRYGAFSLRSITHIPTQNDPLHSKLNVPLSKLGHLLCYQSSAATHLYSQQRPSSNDGMIPVDTKPKFDIKTAFTLVVGQASLIAVATGIAALLGTPNYGLGPSIDLSPVAIRDGILWTAPLGVSALLLDKVEEQLPILKEVTKATQASVLGFMGGSFQPVLGLITATGLGVAAGLGEEMLFRGVMQYELTSRVGDGLALVATSVVFGALHAVTPLYAMLASLASVFFGWLYLSTGNLVIAISCHAFYDLVALMYAHWQVSHMTAEEQEDLLNWPQKGNEVL